MLVSSGVALLIVWGPAILGVLLVSGAFALAVPAFMVVLWLIAARTGRDDDGSWGGASVARGHAPQCADLHGSPGCGRLRGDVRGADALMTDGFVSREPTVVDDDRVHPNGCARSTRGRSAVTLTRQARS